MKNAQQTRKGYKVVQQTAKSGAKMEDEKGTWNRKGRRKQLTGNTEQRTGNREQGGGEKKQVECRG